MGGVLNSYNQMREGGVIVEEAKQNQRKGTCAASSSTKQIGQVAQKR